MLYLMFKLTWITEKELEWVIENKRDEFCRTFDVLSPVQTDATLLANNSQHCWMLHVASVSTIRCMLLDVVACRCAKFDTGQTFQPRTPNISFVPWSPKRSATMLDPFAKLFQHFWGHAHSLRMDFKELWVVFFPRCTAGPKLVGSCCIRLHTTANTHATTPNVVASVCTQPKAQVYKETLKHVHQLSTILIVIRFLSSLSLILSVNKVRLIILGRLLSRWQDKHNRQ